MKVIVTWCVDHWAVTAFIISLFIQVTPIRFSPWSMLFGWIGNMINHNLSAEIEKINDRLCKQEQTIDENEKDRIRFEVLDFANSCRNHRKHTKDEFQHIIVLNEKYEKLLKKTNDTNGVFTAEYNYIMELYQQCQRENSFL